MASMCCKHFTWIQCSNEHPNYLGFYTSFVWFAGTCDRPEKTHKKHLLQLQQNQNEALGRKKVAEIGSFGKLALFFDGRNHSKHHTGQGVFFQLKKNSWLIMDVLLAKSSAIPWR